METSVGDLRTMDGRLISFSGDGTLAPGGFVFSSDAENGLTTDDGIPATTYVTLPFQFLQDNSILDGGPFTVLLDTSHLGMVGTNQVELTTEVTTEDENNQISLGTEGNINTNQVLINAQHQDLGLDMTGMELTTISGEDQVISLQDEEVTDIPEQEDDLLFASETSVSPLPPSPTKRGPGRPRRDESEIVDPPVGKGPFKCAVCNIEFPQWSQLKRHSKFHCDDKPYRCNSCTASFNVEYNLTLHQATHSSGDHCCPQCNKKFSRVASLKAHVILHMKEENLFCSECGDEFATQAQVDEHKKEHLAEWVKNVKVHVCRLCNRQFPRSSAFREHMKEHYKVKASLTHKVHKRNIDRSSFSHKCDACHKSFQKPSQLVRHRRIHTGERPFKCTQCSKAFSQKGSLQIHLCKHSGIRPFECDFCRAMFSQRGNLRAHIVRVHTIPRSGEQVFKCMECPCVFKKLGSLNSHLSRAHSIEGQHKLSEESVRQLDVEAALAHLVALEGDKVNANSKDIVEKAMVSSGIDGESEPVNQNTVLREKRAFQIKEKDCPTLKTVTLSDRAMDGSLRRYLVRTRIVNKIRWLQCSYCNKEFKKPSDLVRHMRIHLMERPFKCNNCFRTFTVKSSLTAHLRTHTGIKEHGCATCFKKFSTISSLKVHQRIHTGTKPFECHICSRKFRTSGHCKSHIAITHNSSGPRQKSSDDARKNPSVNLPEVRLEDPILLTDAGPVRLSRKPPLTSGPERPYKCSTCSIAFRKSSHLMLHQRRHTGERPFACTSCGRRFVSNGVLKAHLRTHEGLKPYSCTLCSHSFSTNGSLKRHFATHSALRPFMCPYCNKTFKSSVSTRKHMKTHTTELAMQVLTQSVKNKNATDPVTIQQSANQEQPTIMETHFASPDFAQAFSDQPFQIVNATSEHMDQEEFVQSTLVPSLISNNMELTTTTGTPSVIMHTLHADASGMITLPNLGQSSENLNELERTLNEQIFGGIVVENSEVHDDGHDNSEVESTTTEDLAQVLNSESREMQMASEQIVSSKNDQAGNMFENMEFDSCVFPSITMQGDVMALDGAPMTTTNMASILPAKSTTTQVCEEGGHALLDEEEEDTEKEPKKEAEPPAIRGRPHVCPECNRAFKKSSHLKAHRLTHSAVRNIECDQCDRKYSSTAALKNHLKTHTKEREFVCPICTCQFTTNGSLMRHMEVHSNKKPFKCSICSLWFRTAMHLRKHIKLHDPRARGSEGTIVAHEVAISPPLRGRKRAAVIRLSAEETENLARQSLLEANSVSEEVLIASAAETNRVSELKDPEEQHQWEPLFPNQCKYCPKSFRKPSDLVRHVRIHTGERPYQCNSCNKCFTVKSTLDSHIKTHSGTKCFTCHVCDCRFSTKGSLKVHMRLHTGAKPFKCPICMLMFRTSGHRKAHIMMHLKDANKTANEAQIRTLTSQRIAKQPASGEEAQLRKQTENQFGEAGASDSGVIHHYQRIEEQEQELEEETLERSQIQGLGTELEPGAQAIFDSQGLGLIPYSDNYGGNPPHLIANGDDNLIALSDNAQFNDFDSSSTILTSSQTLLSGDEQITQQLQDSQEILQTSGEDNEDEIVCIYNAVNLDGSNPGTQFQIICDKFGTVLQIHPYRTDDSAETTIPSHAMNSGDDIEITDVEDQPQLHFRETGKGRTSSGTAPNKVTKKKRRPRDRDEEFLLYHICVDCGKRFDKPSQLQRHRRIHTGERPFACTVCDKTFNQKNALMTHMKSHTGERPHRCDQCEYSSTQKGNLLTHIRRAHPVDPQVNSENLPFKCSYCIRSFSRKFALTAHMKTHTKRDNSANKSVPASNGNVSNRTVNERLMVIGSVTSERKITNQNYIKIEPSGLMDSDTIAKSLDLDSVGDLFPQIRNSDDSHVVLTLQ